MGIFKFSLKKIFRVPRNTFADGNWMGIWTETKELCEDGKNSETSADGNWMGIWTETKETE